ncbi:futalosine hydrolase [Evansella sp. AB-P1]|uniref:futalosine hydrolase n=1 Tax=Evansella sp. AB-P1 TaxID=3037653 RepID=UPI00241F53A4|nr:futalosine hydrolase [Evansella sp. AB-P1]MDG5786197.1 futalosine hydrolase [Evansella sp. AB-P1]
MTITDLENKTHENHPHAFLVMVAVDAEKEAVLRGLQDDKRFDVKLAGVGPTAAAANTSVALAEGNYDLVISAGIGGGFPERIDVGCIAVADEMIAADLGAESSDGFIPIEELGFGSSRIAVPSSLSTKITESIRTSDLPVTSGQIVTLSTVTGTVETAAALTNRYPNVVAEAMEGFGVATAAQIHSIPVMEIRAISNNVGPRDRNGWKIKDALQSLEKAFSAVKEVI